MNPQKLAQAINNWMLVHRLGASKQKMSENTIKKPISRDRMIDINVFIVFFLIQPFGALSCLKVKTKIVYFLLHVIFETAISHATSAISVICRIKVCLLLLHNLKIFSKKLSWCMSARDGTCFLSRAQRCTLTRGHSFYHDRK